MNVQIDGSSAVALRQIKHLTPGYLFTPLGWAAQPLAAIVICHRLNFKPNTRPSSRERCSGNSGPRRRRPHPIVHFE
jgi:hypothetical protein